MSKKNSKFPLVGVIISLVFAFLITFLITNDIFGEQKNPRELYRVYLKGESIGLIESKSELYNYINRMQQPLKEKYHVDTVYISNDISVVKDVAYNENITSINNIYDIINEKSSFTIKGYTVTIDKTNTTDYVDDAQVESDEKDDNNEPKILFLNILDKTMFENALKKTILSVVTEEEYKNFVNGTQKNIVTTGEVIEDLYIRDVITIKEAYLPVNEKIYTSEEELIDHLIYYLDVILVHS
ncbi:MAG: hypothetical protein IJ501_03485 [Bacilli bacterium]|nr:hypothetical protein [Bacilli bacterium]